MSHSCTLIFVEGDTEVVFYRRAKKEFFKSQKSKIKNIHGLYNINKDIVDYAVQFSETHSTQQIRIVICIDRESRNDKAPIDLSWIKEELGIRPNILQNSIFLFEAIQDIESWFLIDIENVYKHLKVPKKQRNFKKYVPFQKFNNRDLSALFRRYNCEYHKGERSEHFIDKLCLKKIKSESEMFADFISLMEK